MKYYLIFILSIIGLSACQNINQFDVLVKNETGEPIQVAYKTSNDVRGEVEETVTIADGELKRIISTSDLNREDVTDANLCKLVAEYINVFKGDLQSKKTWCSEAVKYATVDIGQGEYTLIYTSNDF